MKSGAVPFLTCYDYGNAFGSEFGVGWCDSGCGIARYSPCPIFLETNENNFTMLHLSVVY
jgi:hypothetical protein